MSASEMKCARRGSALASVSKSFKLLPQAESSRRRQGSALAPTSRFRRCSSRDEALADAQRALKDAQTPEERDELERDVIIAELRFHAATCEEAITSDDRELDLLKRMEGVELKTYSFTPEWAQYRNIDPTTTVRGVIAQELETLFPEHVKTLPLDPAGVGLPGGV